jgi:MFS family permease
MGIVALVMAAVTIAGVVSPALLLTLGIALGIGVAFNAPAWHALVPDLVPRSMVTSAVALNSVSANVARAIGPPLAGIVVAVLGAGWAFGFNGASYVWIVVVMTMLGRILAAQERDSASVARAIVTGVKFARHTRAFRLLLILGAMYALTTSVIEAMLPVRTEELGRDVGTYGFLLGSLGLGAALGGLTLGRASRRLGRHVVPWTIVLHGVAGVSVGLAPTLALALAATFLSGVFWIWTVSTINATIQLMAPPWVRGRASSLWLLAYAGMLPLGAVIAGLIANAVGAGMSMAVLSTATVAIGIGARSVGIQDPASVPTPEFTPGRRFHDHPEAEGGPVMISNTWKVASADVREFLTVMEQIRLLRLRTGGYRWHLYREVGAEDIYNETFLVRSWDEHLSQHRRIDDASAELLGRARRLDCSDTGPVARHLLAVDLAQNLAHGEMPVAADDHRSLHAADGSIPMTDH